MGKIRNILLVALMMFLSAFSFSYEPGSYKGEAAGYGGKIEVEVTVSKDRIEDIKVLPNKETPFISSVAIERIPEMVLKKQSLGVDTVAGATVSSRGVLTAITNAVKEAGGDVKELRKRVPAPEIKKGNKEYIADVVVIGGGGAGLAAATSAKQNGASVILIEKMPRLGGNTVLAGGAYNAVDPKRQIPQGIEDSIELHYQQTYEGGDKKGNPKLVRILVENAYPALEWLESLGMTFKDEVFTVLGALYPRSHKPTTPVGTGMILAHKDFAEKNGIMIFYETEAKDFIVKNGKVTGVKAEDAKNKIVFNAKKAVVLATGGFAGDVEYRQKFNSNLTENILTTNHPGGDGTGIKMAEKIGARLIGMEDIQLLPMGDPITGSLSGNIETTVEDRIFVNKDGKRFVAEDERRDVMTNALFKQKDAFMWVIVDSKVYPTLETKNNFNEPIGDLIKAGRAVKADTLDELAEKIGVPADNLKKTIADYNQSVDTKKDPFGRKLFGIKFDKAPYYAGPRIPTVHHTMGGVEINEKAQVINTKGNPIPGLYAAGEVTGGIHGTNRLGGNALADITVFGRIAGENAAKEK